MNDYHKKVKSPILIVVDEYSMNDPKIKIATQKMAKLSHAEILAPEGWKHASGLMLTPDKIIQPLLDFYQKHSL